MQFVSRQIVAALIVAGSVVAGQAQTGSSLAFQRAEHLRRGVNLSMWYAQTRDHSAAHIDSFTNAPDFALIKSLGFDHVRLSIDPEPLTQSKKLGSLRVDAVERLDRSVQQIQAAGLNVILDIHPEQEWKDEISKGEDGPQQLYAFWSTFAGHYAATDPERVFFEVMNEPNLNDGYRWAGIQARAIERIRKVAPQHTIIATAAGWGSLDQLLALEPVRDEDVIYTFHYYSPFWFTHQGAQWGSQEWVTLHGIPYPSTPENVQEVIGQEPDERSRLDLQRYGYDQWNAKRIGMEIAAAADWAQRRGVPLYMGEFGVFRDFSKPEMRDTWISDVRTAAESKKIGWAMWDYQANFGLVQKGPKGTVVDEGVLRALGMKR
jgi:aryl-phospho-beta-D-glucosidase BglC (GH1 family)